jgi:DNA repair protein RadA/Sms
MAKTVRTAYACTECGAASPRWIGRCPACGAWNSLVEEVLERTAPARASGPVTPPVPITEVAAQAGAHRPTGVEELDRVLGGGLVAGSVVLLAGEPGIGKSTLLLGVLAGLAADGPVLYVCAEESREQVRLRAERLGALHPGLLLAAETDLGAVRALIDQVKPTVVVVDSVQTVADPELAGAPGGVGQVREVAAQLVRLAKERSIATFLVGQVTKEGAVAGPKTMEHLVDVVLNFEGDQHHALRLVRCTKNRFGPAYEVGCSAWRAAGRSSPRSRPWPCPPGWPCPGAPPRGWTPAAWPSWSPCSTAGPASAWPATTSSPPPPAGSGSPSPRPTWPSAWPWPRPPATGRSPPT